MEPYIRIVDYPRPESMQEEIDLLFNAYRKELEDIANLLRLPGSPSLTGGNIYRAVKRLIDGIDK